jgi:Zn-dependent M28 family amino/carboxypeptidase
MIGRNSPDTLVAIGLEYSTLGDRARQVAASRPELKLAVVADLWPAERFFFRSDHYNFARTGVPAVFFFSGVHADYHQPSDEAARIDAEKAARIARLAFHLGLDISQSTEAPSWTAEGRSALQAGGR